jgi:hypothetical protein
MQKVNKVLINNTMTGKKEIWYMGGRLRDRVGRYATEKAEKGFSLVQRIEMWCWAMAKKWLIYPVVIGSIIACILWVSGTFLVSAYVDKVEPTIHTVEKVVKDNTFPPVMQHILKCESSGKHFDKKGNVLKGIVDPDDTGKWQINFRYHGKEAMAMGLNLYNEKDNDTYAWHLYETQGTEPWSASKNCWFK